MFSDTIYLIFVDTFFTKISSGNTLVSLVKKEKKKKKKKKKIALSLFS